MRSLTRLVALSIAVAAPSAHAAGDGVLWYYGNSGYSGTGYTTLETQVTDAGASTFDATNTWPDSLDDYRIVFLVTPARLFSPTAIENLQSFIDGGGVVALLGDTGSGTATSVMNNLLGELGLASTYETDTADSACTATGVVVDSHPLNECISALTYGGTGALTPGSDAVTLFTGDSDQVLVAVEGSVVLFTDRDIVMDTCTTTDDNERFMRQLFEGLTDLEGDADCDGEESVADGGADCDDADAAINPSATDVCDGLDNNCDGTADDDPTLGSTFYTDNDLDGFGTTAGEVVACEAPYGYADNTRDCDDDDSATNPDADEVCDEKDNNCNGARDDSPVDGILLYADDDGDSYGDDTDTMTSCEGESGYVEVGGDCDDSLARVKPGAEEYCNDTDDDCDGSVDEDATNTTTWYTDGDGDGFGDAASSVEACDAPDGMITDNRDCDDADPSIYPGAPGWSMACMPLDDGTTDTSTDDGEDKGGCGCAATDTSGALAWSAAGLALALAARRRRA